MPSHNDKPILPFLGENVLFIALFRLDVPVGDDPQTFQRQIGINSFDLRQLPRDQLRVTARRYDLRFLSRKIFARDPDENLTDQSPIAEDRARHHGAARCFPDSAFRLAQSKFRQQRGALIEKTGHRFEAGRDHSADIIAAGRYDVEGHGRSKIDDDGGVATQLRNCRCVCEPVGADGVWRGIINADTKIEPCI
ncbi:MAG: hypothetical protein QOK24_1962 [Verrucomicrobiota bacterium]